MIYLSNTTPLLSDHDVDAMLIMAFIFNIRLVFLSSLTKYNFYRTFMVIESCITTLWYGDILTILCKIFCIFTAIWKEKLLRSYKFLVQDTPLYEVADSCFENGLIEDEQREKIMKLKTTSEKNRHFINLLLHQSQISYQNFLKCLTDEFDWIKERIEDTEVDSLPPSPGNKYKTKEK